MPKKEKQEAVRAPKFPTHHEIDQPIKSSVETWAHQKGPYPLPVLEFFTNEIGCQLDTIEDADDSGPDDEFYNPFWYVKGVTNGELFYSLYRTILSMTEDQTFVFGNLRQPDQQIFASMLELATTLFLDRRGETDFVGDSVDLWILYKWCRQRAGFALWTNEAGVIIEPPPLECMTDDDWQMMADDVVDHFLDGDQHEYVELALLDEQPHWPTFQELRTAKAQLRWWYELTRGNQRSSSSGGT